MDKNAFAKIFWAKIIIFENGEKAYVAEVKNIVLQLFQLNTGMKFSFFP